MNFDSFSPIISAIKKNYNLISFCITILAIILSVYFYRKGKKKKKPTYIVKTNNLVKGSVQKIRSVQILYADKTIANLSATKILFWNDGNETIDHTDVAKRNPIRIIIDQKYEILEADILYTKNEDNNFNIKPHGKSIQIKFDYINANEGIIIQLFHTGFSSDDVKIEGGVKSVKRIKRKELNQSFFSLFLKKHVDNMKQSLFIKIFGYSVFIAGTILCLVGIFCPEVLSLYPNPKHLSDYNLTTSKIVFISGGIIYIYLGWMLIRRKIPKGFNIFYQ